MIYLCSGYLSVRFRPQSVELHTYPTTMWFLSSKKVQWAPKSNSKLQLVVQILTFWTTFLSYQKNQSSLTRSEYQTNLSVEQLRAQIVESVSVTLWRNTLQVTFTVTWPSSATSRSYFPRLYQGNSPSNILCLCFFLNLAPYYFTFGLFSFIIKREPLELDYPIISWLGSSVLRHLSRNTSPIISLYCVKIVKKT